MRNKLLTMASVCLILALVALSIVSCGEVEPGPTPEPTGLQRGGILRIITLRGPRGIGWIRGGWLDKTIKATCVEELLRYKDETGVCVGWLAESWEADANALTMTLHLRKGVKFHDGSDFNAEVCKWNIDTYQDAGLAELKAIESIDIIDDYTVRLNLSQWNNLIPSHLASYSGYMHSKVAYEKYGPEWLDNNPVGTGPFKFVSWEKDVSIKFERFDDYWQEGKPYLDGVEWIQITDPLVAAVAFGQGQGDILLDISPKEAHDLEATGKYNIAAVASGREVSAPDSVNPDSPLADVRVRQACDYAVDRQAIADALGYGFWLPTNQFVTPGSWFYNPDVVGYPYNPEKARELLAEAGYADGFKTALYCDPGIQSWNTSVQAYLQEVGIDVEVDVASSARTGEWLQKGWEGGFISRSIGRSPVDDLAILHNYFREDRAFFVSMFVSAEVQDVLAEAVEATDLETRQAKFWEFSRLMVDECACGIWLLASNKIAPKYPQVHDDGLFEFSVMQWSPADAWLSK